MTIKTLIQPFFFSIFLFCSLYGNAKNFNVKDFGATGNGKTDDKAAIQATINAAANNMGNSVFFPKGIYLIGSYISTPNYFENYCLKMQSNLKFCGEGTTSIIRLKSHLFDKRDSFANAHIFYGVNISNVSFENLFFDMNGRFNLAPENVIKNNCAIFIDHGSNIQIKKITAVNCAGRNMLIIKGAGKNIIIDSNCFYNGGNYVGFPKANKYQTDFSFIYCEWDSAIITNNHIEQKNIDIALNGYTGGIEIHGSYSYAAYNAIIGCYPGFFISSTWQPMINTKIENNQMLQCLKGISFWIHYPLTNISILNNTIELTHSRLLKPSILAGIDVPNGNEVNYNFKLANNAPLNNLQISGNSITTKATDKVTDKFAGMVLHSLKNSIIKNNRIANMNYGGLVFQGSKWGMENVTVSNNNFVDFKNNDDPKAVGGYIIITDTYSPNIKNAPGIKNINFENNRFTRTALRLSSNKLAKNKGVFLGAFVALPEKMLKEIHFNNNQFQDKTEGVRFVKTN